MTDETDTPADEEPAPERGAGEDAPRGRLLPVAIPAAAVLGTLILVFSLSRILLAISQYSKGITAVVALFVALNVLVGAALVSIGRRVRGRRPASFPLLVVAGLLVVGGGAAAIAIGTEPEKEVATEATIVAQTLAFNPTAVELAAGVDTTIHFDNRDGVQHNIHVFEGQDQSGTSVFVGDLVTGPATADYRLSPQRPGSYHFQCDVHPTMTGTIRFIKVEGQKPRPGPTETETSAPPPKAPPNTVIAKGIQFATPQATATLKGGKVHLVFDNRDAGVPHNVVVFDGSDDSAPQLFRGEIVTGPAQAEYVFEAQPGEYFFHCEVHPTMTGTLTVTGG
ncbi:MAG TPA: cupredoxin domain-containing protein [Actinomycetota bacterium]|nr:cupredoxin domain-containing protein [Actinomycetota bacterium]